TRRGWAWNSTRTWSARTPTCPTAFRVSGTATGSPTSRRPTARVRGGTDDEVLQGQRPGPVLPRVLEHGARRPDVLAPGAAQAVPRADAIHLQHPAAGGAGGGRAGR